MADIDKLNCQDDLFLNPEQSIELQKVESAIANADLVSLNSVLHRYKDNPDGIKRIMDVLVRDLAAAGIRASYDIDVALSSDSGEGTARTGMFDMSTARTPEEWMSTQSTLICFYTNPNSRAWAHLEVPVKSDKRALRAPDMVHIPTEQGLKEIAAKFRANLRRQQ